MLGIVLIIQMKVILADVNLMTLIMTAMTSPQYGRKRMTTSTMIGMLALLVSILVICDLKM
jgi:hypothetical protein